MHEVWEYKVLRFRGEGSEEEMNRLGEQGWELVAPLEADTSGTALRSAPQVYLIFKRRRVAPSA
jgi:hypothetical protein